MALGDPGARAGEWGWGGNWARGWYGLLGSIFSRTRESSLLPGVSLVPPSGRFILIDRRKDRTKREEGGLTGRVVIDCHLWSDLTGFYFYLWHSLWDLHLKMLHPTYHYLQSIKNFAYFQVHRMDEFCIYKLYPTFTFCSLMADWILHTTVLRLSLSKPVSLPLKFSLFG